MAKAEVAFHKAAQADLLGIYDYIETHGSPERAWAYMGRIEAACDRLSDFPEIGSPRDDIALGIRTWSLERRVLIAYRVSDDGVEVLRVLYAGRDFKSGDVPI